MTYEEWLEESGIDAFYLTAKEAFEAGYSAGYDKASEDFEVFKSE